MPESEEYDTLAGWVLSALGHIPVVGERATVGDAEVRVQLVRRRRISRLRVKRKARASAGGGDEGETSGEAGS